MLDRRSFLSAAFPLLARAAKPVRITGLDMYSVQVPTPKEQVDVGVQDRYQVAEIHTDAGVTGYSFAAYPPAQLPALRGMVLGKDLFNIDEILKAGILRFAGVEHA